MESTVHHVIELTDPEEINDILTGSDWGEWFHNVTPEYQYSSLLMGPEGHEEEVRK